MPLSKQRIGVGFVILLVFNLIVFNYIIILTENYNIDPFGLNPEQTNLRFTLSYPPPTNGEIQPIWLVVKFTLFAETQISENTIINFNGGGSAVYIQDVTKIDSAIVGFYNTNSNYTVYYNPKNVPYLLVPGFLVFMDASIMNDLNDPHLPEQYHFSFPVSGDYSPTISILLNNNTYLTHTYDDIKVHVMSTSEIQSQQIGRIGAFFAVVVVFFGDIEALKLILDWSKIEPKYKTAEKPEQKMGYSY